MSQMRDFATYVHINSSLYINLENGNANNCLQAALLFWQHEWCVRSTVDVIMTSTFVSGPTAHRWHSLQLKQLVNNEIILSYRASLTASFSPNWQSFVMLRITCYSDAHFGLMSKQLLSTTGTGLMALHLQVCLCLHEYVVWGAGGDVWEGIFPSPLGTSAGGAMVAPQKFREKMLPNGVSWCKVNVHAFACNRK